MDRDDDDRPTRSEAIDYTPCTLCHVELWQHPRDHEFRWPL